MDLYLDPILWKLDLAPPKKVMKNPQSKAKNPRMVDAPDSAARAVVHGNLVKLLAPVTTIETKMERQGWYSERTVPVERRRIKIQDLYEQLPVAVASLSDPYVSAAFADVSWDDLVGKEIAEGIATANRHLTGCETELRALEEKKRQCTTTVEAWEALGERVLKRPRH